MPGKIARVGRGDRIRRIGDIERGGAVVGVDHDLHGVADVVDAAAGGRRVRIAVARRVGVVDPEQAAVGEHQIRIAIEGEERRDLGDALADVAVEDDAALGR